MSKYLTEPMTIEESRLVDEEQLLRKATGFPSELDFQLFLMARGAIWGWEAVPPFEEGKVRMWMKDDTGKYSTGGDPYPPCVGSTCSRTPERGVKEWLRVSSRFKEVLRERLRVT